MNAECRDELTFDGLVHDLNNVFQTIIDAADFVGTDPRWNSIAAMILRSVEQGRRIVTSIADTDAGVVDLECVCGQATTFTNDFMVSLKRPPVQFVLDCEPGIRLEARARSLERVLVNLFINAAQASAAANRNECCVTVTARTAGVNVEISIADDGPGVAPEIAAVIFTPHFSTDPEHHSGLGLHIVRSSVEAAGGEVKMENGAAGGAVFTILLPAPRPEVRLRHVAAAG